MDILMVLIGFILSIVSIVLTYTFRLKLYELAVEVIELFDIKQKAHVIVNIAKEHYKKKNYYKAISLLVRSIKLNKDIEAYRLI